MTAAAAPDGASPSSFNWSAKALALAGGSTVSFALSAVSPVLPKIEAALAHGPEDALLVKMLVGVVGIGLLIGAPLTGFLCNRVGLRVIFAVNFLAITIAGLLGLIIDDLHVLIVARFVTGLAAAGAITASTIVINTRLAPADRATWMGFYLAVAMFSGIIMRPLTGLVGEYDWHWVFVIYLAGAPFVLIALLWFKDLPLAADTTRTTGKGDPIYRWFPFRFLLVGLSAGAITYLPAIYVPFLLRDMGISSPFMISLVLMGDAITAGIAAVLFGRLRRRVSERMAFVLTFGAAVIGLVITALAPDYVTVMVGMAIFGIALAWFFPNLLVAISERVTPEQQGRAAGLIKASHYGANPISIMVAQPIAALYGAEGVIIAGALLSLLIVAIYVYHMIARTPLNHGVAVPGMAGSRTVG